MGRRNPEYVKAWKKANADKMHAAYLRYRAKYPERFPAAAPKPILTPEEKKRRSVENSKRWHAENPEKVKASRQRSREKHREKRAATIKAWRKKNANHVRAKKREWTASHPGSNNERSKRWRERNIEKARILARVTVKKWQSKNPEKVAVYRSRSHAKRKSQGRVAGIFTPTEWAELLDRYDHKCACCGIHESQSIYRYVRAGVPLIGKLTVDHVIPLSKGGSGSIENIAPLCLPCNTKKHAKDTDYRKKVA